MIAARQWTTGKLRRCNGEAYGRKGPADRFPGQRLFNSSSQEATNVGICVVESVETVVHDACIDVDLEQTF